MRFAFCIAWAMITFHAIEGLAQSAPKIFTDSTLAGLRAVIIESSKANSSTAPLYANNIREARVLTALDAILKLRPVILNAETGTCTSKDSLSLYVDGVRRLTSISISLPSVVADSLNQSDLWTTAGKALDKSVMGSRPQRKVSSYDKQPRSEWIRTELSQIRASNIKSIHYVPCDGWSRDIGMRNVIWIELKE